MGYRSRLFQYWKQKELEQRQNISVLDVAKATGLHRSTIQSLLDDTTRRFDDPVISAICTYFNVAPGPVPWLVYEPDEKEPGQL